MYIVRQYISGYARISEHFEDICDAGVELALDLVRWGSSLRLTTRGKKYLKKWHFFIH